MNIHRHWTSIAAIAALGLVACGASAQQQLGSFERTLDVGSGLALDVRTGSGSIEVTGGAAGRVEVVGRITASGGGFFGRVPASGDLQERAARIEADPPIELVGNRLTIGNFDDQRLYHDLSISYEIVVPADAEVESASGSGAQTIVGVAGPVEVSTGSGRVTVNDVGGDVEARTGSGAIRAERIAGDFRGQAGSGSIRLTQTAPGDVDVSTGSGSTELVGIDGALRARSGSGSIDVEGSLGGDWTVDAGSGSVTLQLPSDAAFDLDADAHSGGITTNHPVSGGTRIERGRLTGEVRGGGPLLRVRTGSGSIRIE